MIHTTHILYNYPALGLEFILFWLKVALEVQEIAMGMVSKKLGYGICRRVHLTFANLCKPSLKVPNPLSRSWTCLNESIIFYEWTWNFFFYSIEISKKIITIAAIICHNDELTWVQLISNPWLFLVFILNQNLNWSLE